MADEAGLKTSGGATRRTIVLGAGGVALAAALPVGEVARADEVPTRVYTEALAKLLAGRTAVAKGVKLELPDLAENGNMVPFKVEADSPMTDADHIRTITLLSTGNPQAVIATFRLGPASGAARVSGRLRLARTQDLIAIAETNAGVLLSGSANVKVTIGGCGG